MLKIVAALAILLQVMPLLASASSPLNIDPIDPKYIVMIDDRYYYFSTVYHTVPEAMFLCNEINMTLVSLETQQEYDAVNNYIATNLATYYGYWTSGTRQYTTWIWSGVGRHITYFNWDSSEPTVTDGSTQSNIYVYGGLMWDASPSWGTRFICEQLHI